MIEFDVFLDCFFLFEIVYNFFVAFESQGVSCKISKVAYFSSSLLASVAEVAHSPLHPKILADTF